MKTILLLRHAKSDWNVPAPDHERPLNKRGRLAAVRVGRFLSRSGQIPELVITSSALRARDTVGRAVRAGSWKTSITTSDALYASSPEAILAEIQRQDDRVGRLLLAGHEPTWSLLASGLCGGLQLRFPTAAVARIDFEVERWREVQLGTGELVWLLPPRLLASSTS